MDMNEILFRWIIRKRLTGKNAYLYDISHVRSDEDKVKLALRYLSRYETPPDIHQQGKCTEKAIEYIEQGDKNFQSTPWQQLVEIYTEGIIHAQPGSNELARGYGNRSAALCNGGLYEDSLMDIDRALKIGYPDTLKAKLYARRAKCLVGVNKKMSPEVREAVADARKWYEKMNNANKKCVTKILNKLCNASSIKEPYKKRDYNKFLPRIPDDNPNIMGASAAVELKYSKKFGRHVVATRNINAGEVLSVNKAYAAISHLHLHHKYCWNCSKRAWAGVPCHQCVAVIYCNDICRDEAWKEHHDIECSVIPAILDANMTIIDLMSLRLAVKAYKEAGSLEDLQKMKDEIDAIHDPIAKCLSNNVFDNTKYASVYSLWRYPNVEFPHALRASLILHFLASRTRIFGEKIVGFAKLLTNKWTMLIGGLIMAHIEICQMNAIEVSMHDDDGNKLDCRAALIPFVSLLNHNCDPTFLQYTCGNMKVGMSLQKIKKGEQIFISYSPVFFVDPVHARRIYLLQCMNFLCDCTACIQNWGPNWRESFSSHVIKSWPADIMKQIFHILQKYPHNASLISADIEDKPMIISNAFDMMNFYQCVNDYPTREMMELKILLHGLYTTIRC